MKLIRYFKHIDFTSASDQNMMGIAMDMGDFLRTVEMGRQVRKKSVATQTVGNCVVLNFNKVKSIPTQTVEDLSETFHENETSGSFDSISVGPPSPSVFSKEFRQKRKIDHK